MSESEKKVTSNAPAIVYKTKDLENDFHWLNNIGVKQANEELFMEVNGKLVNSEVSMPESVFVQNWLWQFAVGLVGDHCYFNLTEWHELTNNGKLSVVVTDDEKPEDIVLVIKPFTETGLTKEEISKMRMVGANLSLKALMPDLQERSRIFTEGISYLANNINSKRKEFEDFIPSWFFEKHKVYPWVYKHVIYIRDTFNYDPNSKALGVIENILTKYHLKQKLSKVEVDFIKAATGNTIELQLDYEIKGSQEGSQESPISPDEC